MGKRDRKRRRFKPQKLKPSEVFTPNTFPLEEHNAYASRAEAEAGLQQAMDRERTPVIFGEFGVGKTTLVKRFFLPEHREHRFIHMLTPKDKSIEHLAQIVLERLNYSVNVSEDRHDSGSITGTAQSSQFLPVSAKLSGTASQSRTVKRELVVRSPTDQALLEIMAKRRLVIAVDEMHKASAAFQSDLAEMIKAVNTQGNKFPKIVVLGTAAAASDLVELDEGIDRLVKEIAVAPMTPEESAFVVTDGMGKLDVSMADDLVDAVVQTAAGSPALVHEMCLDIALRARERDTFEAREEDVDFAVKHFLTENHARLTARYMQAIETMGPRRYRKQILRAMAESPKEFVTRDELALRVSEYVGADVPGDTLSGPLRELKDGSHGRLLRDIERSNGGRVHNLTAFNDPQMKAFIRAIVAAESSGRALTESEIATLPEPAPD